MDQSVILSSIASRGGCPVGKYNLSPSMRMCTSCEFICPHQGTDDWSTCQEKCPEVYNASFNQASSAPTSDPTEPSTTTLKIIEDFPKVRDVTDEYMSPHLHYLLPLGAIAVSIVIVGFLLYKKSQRVQLFLDDIKRAFHRCCREPPIEPVSSTTLITNPTFSNEKDAMNDEHKPLVEGIGPQNANDVVTLPDTPNTQRATYSRHNSLVYPLPEVHNTLGRADQSRVSIYPSPVQEQSQNGQFRRQMSNPETSLRGNVQVHRAVDDSFLRGQQNNNTIHQGNRPCYNACTSNNAASHFQQPMSYSQQNTDSQRFGTPVNTEATFKVETGCRSFEFLPK